MESTAFNRDAFYQAEWNPCIHHAAWTPLHTIGIHCATMHGIHCIQSGCILISCMESIQSSRCMDSAAYSRDPLRHNAWNPLHSMTLHGIHCIKSRCFGPCRKNSTAFNHAEGIHCIQSCCIISPAFNRVPFLHAAWNTLLSIMLHGIHSI